MISIEYQKSALSVTKWSAANRLTLNLEKIYIIKFIANHSPQHALNTGYNRKGTEESVNLKKIPWFEN
jgi:hypothetical protein